MPVTQSSNLDPDSFMQGQQPAVTPEGYMATANVAAPDALQQALNYHTGHIAADIPIGLAQGAAKGLASTGYGLLDLANKVVPNPIQLDPNYRASLTVPNGVGQGTGKFLEQAAEFALPSAGMSKLTDGANILTRMAGQAAVGSGVAAAQSGGDPTATAIGGALGPASELGGSLIKMIGAPKAATAQNFIDSLAAVPTQKVAVNRAFDTLVKDGVQPGKDLPEMAQTIKGKLADLGQQYAALDPKIDSRTTSAQGIIQRLRNLQADYRQGGVVSPANQPYYGKIQDEIDTVKALAGQNLNALAKQSGLKGPQLLQFVKGLSALAKEYGIQSDQLSGLRGSVNQVSFSDLKYLRDGMNGKTNWTATEAERNLYNDIGNAYRGAMDQIAPETTDLNRKYAQYKALDSVAQHNLEMGRGTTKSGLTSSLESAADRPIGAALGAAIGSHFPGGEYVGTILGASLYPKLAKPAVEALQQAAQSGSLQKLGGAQLNSLVNALKRSDTQAILGLVGKGSTFHTLTNTSPAIP